LWCRFPASHVSGSKRCRCAERFDARRPTPKAQFNRYSITLLAVADEVID